MKYLLLATAALSSTLAFAAEPQFDMKRVSDDIRVMSADDFQGRAPATVGETKTVAFLIDRMKAAGLEPGGTIGADSNPAGGGSIFKITFPLAHE